MAGSRVTRVVLLSLNGLLAGTAIAGGLALLTGANAPPVAELRGSPFDSYTVPGFVLLVMVGGSALVAATLLWRQHWLGPRASGIAGGVLITFEVVEVLALGSPAGAARNLQVFYVTLGLLLALLAMRTGPRPTSIGG